MDIKDLKVNLESKILKSNKVIILPHLGVDFDAIASALGISLITKKLKKVPYILIDDPVYKIDHGVKLILEDIKKDFSIINKEKYKEIKDKEDLFVLTDVNKSYLISIADQINNPDNIIIIDHHDSDSKTLNSNNIYIDTNISSVSEEITNLLSLFKVKYNSNIADYLLAGIYLDTNKLTKNVTSETMKSAAKLVDNGANLNSVMNLFTEDFNSDRKVQELVSKAKLVTYTIGLILADEGDEYTKEELAKAADYMLKFDVNASYAIGNIGDNTISISARAKDKVNVGEVMRELSGGGNQYSAATKLENTTIEEASKKLIKTIEPPHYI